MRTQPSRLATEFYGPYRDELKHGKAALEFVLAAVCVCKSVEEFVRGLCPRCPTLVLGNGVEPGDIRVREQQPTISEAVHLFFVCGSPSTWTGDDRLLRSLLEYRGKTRFVLHCVGHFAAKIQRMAQRVDSRHTIHFHGLKTRPELLAMADQAHLGVASLGLHRLNLWDASTLKVREYMAMGLPFLTGYQDVDIPPDYPYCLRFPADEAPLDLEKVEPFLAGLAERGFSPERMRSESLGHIEVAGKARVLVDFLNGLQ